ncbi:MAG: ribbon-helix-helix protein, CopG family [Pseudonocardiaceae bacterium]
MRTTVSLDDDVAAAVQRLRAERNIGLSEAVNELARAGLTVPSQRTRFIQRTFPMGARLDVTNVGDALEYLEGHSHR